MTPSTPHGAPAPGPEPAGYAAALSELEQILERLERSDVDVDVLATQVGRAAVLIRFCRERIGSARLQIDQAIGGLTGTDAV